MSSEASAGTLDARDARCDAIVQMLRDREGEDRAAREKRQRFWYKQSLESDSAAGASVSATESPTRLYRFRTNVPCRATPQARALLDELRKQFSGRTVNFAQLASGQRAVMVAASGRRTPKQIGRMEQSVRTEPGACNAREQGLLVDTDGGSMLVLRFRYAPTAVKVSCPPSDSDEVTCRNFAEVRVALDLQPPPKGSIPRLVWITRPEAEMLNAFGSRDYESFYVRFKLEVVAGIWNSLSAAISGLPSSRWHQGSHYTVVREAEPSNGRICQRTVDDCGRVVEMGFDRIYDAFPATDILLLYLDADILADIADVYFTLQSLRSPDAYFLKEEFFTVIRKFWAASQSLVSCYGSDLAAVLRMAQRAVPMPAQAALLKQDWLILRQSLVDRYGEGGRKAGHVISQDLSRPSTGMDWPFACFPPGEVNVGLRFIYRQECTPEGTSSPDGFVRGLDAGIGPTSPAEIQNVVLVAERLPAPADINLSWVRRHDWILTKVLLDESFRDALDTIGLDTAEEQLDLLSRDIELNTKRVRLYKHIKANVLHYQRAIWQQEDPQQRCMRYRKSGTKVPLEWRFELEQEAALTIDELCDRLAATSVDGQFASYSGGQEADLDQLIDPAGPIAYYGNYAIYHMRPEFGNEEVFSMLHFFKSSYLHANPETGAPEIRDPAEAEKLALVLASDPAIELHRDGVFACAPKLRLNIGTSDSQLQLDVSARPSRVQPGVLIRRSHLPLDMSAPDSRPKLDVRARSPQLHLDAWARTTVSAGTDTNTVGVVRGAEPRTLTPSGDVHVNHSLGTRGLLAGSRAAPAHDAVSEHVLLRVDTRRISRVRPGSGAARVQERVVGARDESRLRPSPIAG